MKKNLIIRKRHLLTIPMLLMVMVLGGCTPKVTVDTYTHEAGEELLEDAAVYAEFKNPENAKEAVVDVSEVDADKVGTYEAAITLNEKEYPFTVEVVDTTAPAGTFKELVVTCGIDEKVTTELFECETTDISELKHGLRNALLLKNEEELKEVIRINLEEAEKAGNEQISYIEMADVTWNGETDTWVEQNVSWDSFENEFVPEENGLYRLEKLHVDEFGNADVSYCYVIADLTAPVFTRAEDVEVKMTNSFEEYMNSLNAGLAVEDNYLGDITYKVEVTGTETASAESSDIAMKVYYEVEDIAGNKAEASRNLRYGKVEISTSEQASQSYSNGHDRAKAEQAFAQVNQQRAAAGLHELVWDESLYEFACTRSTQIVTDFSHNLPDGTGVSKYLLHNVGGASGYGENIARNYKSITNLINGWMNSQGHKENILDSRYTAGVMACYYCNGSYYWVNLFKAQ